MHNDDITMHRGVPFYEHAFLIMVVANSPCELRTCTFLRSGRTSCHELFSLLLRTLKWNVRKLVHQLASLYPHDTLQSEVEKVSIILAIWASLLGAWIYVGIHLFPPTIHPMIVHFPIALLYLALLIEIARFFRPYSEGRFLDRIGYYMTVLSVLACIAAAAAGVISEQYVPFTSASATLLAAHQRDAVITTLAAMGAVILRTIAKYPRHQSGWTLMGTGRGRPSRLSSLLVLIAVIMVSITGHLGGTMVYHYGAGTPMAFKRPSALAPRVQARLHSPQ